jgi:hypothetical protein
MVSMPAPDGATKRSASRGASKSLHGGWSNCVRCLGHVPYRRMAAAPASAKDGGLTVLRTIVDPMRRAAVRVPVKGAGPTSLRP